MGATRGQEAAPGGVGVSRGPGRYSHILEGEASTVTAVRKTTRYWFPKMCNIL